MTDLDKMARELLPVDICRYGYEVDEMATVVSFSTAIDAIRTALLTAPPGYVLVPVEPTEEMETANAMYGDTSDWWNAVITAAPEVKP